MTGNKWLRFLLENAPQGGLLPDVGVALSFIDYLRRNVAGKQDAFPIDQDNPQALILSDHAGNNDTRHPYVSGRGPSEWLNDQWKEEFVRAHGYEPTMEDYAWRFYTMAKATGWLRAKLSNDAESIDFQLPDPDHIYFNLAKNLEKAEDRMGLIDFYQQVRPGGPWDYKKYSDAEHDYEAFGNFHYGVMGRALGLSKPDLLQLAGLAQYVDDRLNELHGKEGNPRAQGYPWWRRPYGDDPRDQAMIELGIDFYDAYAAATSRPRRLWPGSPRL